MSIKQKAMSRETNISYHHQQIFAEFWVSRYAQCDRAFKAGGNGILLPLKLNSSVWSMEACAPCPGSPEIICKHAVWVRTQSLSCGIQTWGSVSCTSILGVGGVWSTSYLWLKNVNHWYACASSKGKLEKMADTNLLFYWMDATLLVREHWDGCETVQNTAQCEQWGSPTIQLVVIEVKGLCPAKLTLTQTQGLGWTTETLDLSWTLDSRHIGVSPIFFSISLFPSPLFLSPT